MGGLEQYAPAWLLAIAGTLTALVAIAAAARRPPVTWAGRGIGWILKRLVGEPFAKWGHRELREQVLPIIREEVANVVAEAVQPQMDSLHDCVDGVKGDVAAVKADTVRLRADTDALKVGQRELSGLVDTVLEIRRPDTPPS